MIPRFEELLKKGLFKDIPNFITELDYEVIMGSFAYGVSNTTSDLDVYAWCVPPLDIIFPHLQGIIFGFNNEQGIFFNQFQQHHVEYKDYKFDYQIYSVVKYCRLCMVNNPNMIDSLFVPERCVLTISNVGKILRENRKKFLHKGAYHRFKGYAYSQLNKLRNKQLKQFVDLCNKYKLDPYNTDVKTIEDKDLPEKIKLEFIKIIKNINTHNISKRLDTIIKYGYDVKFAYHLVRLLNECVQILTEYDLDLERNREQLKSIRRGEWTIEEIEDYFKRKEAELEELYVKSTIPYCPDENEIKRLLLNCIEEKHGRIPKDFKVDNNINRQIVDQVINLLKQIR